MKKALALLTAVMLWLTAGTAAAFANPATAVYQQFADISQPAWGAQIMKRMIQTGIMQGYQGTGAESSTFYAYPNQPVSRAEFAVLLARSLNLPDSGTTPPLADWSSVPAWARPKVAALFNQHVVQGQPGPGGRVYFAGADYITRAELVAMLERALVQNGGTTSTTAPSGTTGSTTQNGTTGTTSQNGGTTSTTAPSGTTGSTTQNGTTGTVTQNGTTSGTTQSGTTGSTTQSGATGTTSQSGTTSTTAPNGATGTTAGPNPFQDVTAQDWYYDYVLAAYQAGIVQGEAPNYFGPSGDATRVEVMAMLWRSLTGDKTDLPADTELVTPVQQVNNLVMGVLGGQDKSELAPYLTGEAALGLSKGNFFLLETAALQNVSQAQISYPAGPPRVTAKSRYLATVETTVNLYVGFSGSSQAPPNYQVVEYYHLIRDDGHWLIYAVDTYSLSINGGPPTMVDQSSDLNGGF